MHKHNPPARSARTRYAPVYWLLREVGKEHGFAVVSLDEAISSEEAIAVWRDDPDTMLDLFAGVEVEAKLVAMRIVDGQPVVTPVA